MSAFAQRNNFKNMPQKWTWRWHVVCCCLSASASADKTQKIKLALAQRYSMILLQNYRGSAISGHDFPVLIVSQQRSLTLAMIFTENYGHVLNYE